MADHEERSLSGATQYTPQAQDGTIPRIPLNMREHKKPLAIAAILMMTSSGILPVILYYIIKYGGGASDTVAITIPTVVFGAYSLVNLFIRLYSLLRSNSTSRPIGATKRNLDYFQFNFIVLFVALTGLIAGGCALAGSEDLSQRPIALRIVSMGLPVLMLCVCIQLALIFTVTSFTSNLRYPFRFSSMRKGQLARAATYTIAEDVVAVDGKQGTEFRRTFNERYLFSEDVRGLLRWADAAWGFSGVLVGTVLIIIAWTVPNPNVGFVLSWILPWIWALCLTWLTIQRTKAALQQESSRYGVEKHSLLP